jgi:ribonuclease HI
MIELWTDGSSRGNPGDGGCAVIVVKDNVIIQEYKEFFEDVTNN